MFRNAFCIFQKVKRDSERKKEKKKAEEAYFITTKELAEAGRDNIPEELISSKHLIYSSPATLAYNSPGAQGFGVKRAGLAIPGAVNFVCLPTDVTFTVSSNQAPSRHTGETP